MSRTQSVCYPVLCSGAHAAKDMPALDVSRDSVQETAAEVESAFHLLGNCHDPRMLHKQRQQGQRGLAHIHLIAAHSTAQRAQQPALHGLPDVLRPLPDQLTQQLQGFSATA